MYSDGMHTTTEACTHQALETAEYKARLVLAARGIVLVRDLGKTPPPWACGPGTADGSAADQFHPALGG